ncbi:MAG: serine/threonine protein kinase, partial [Muribaculaceae bacterium]|nr:serine/threonine protein kinase [Muribaculaceae bacterium]
MIEINEPESGFLTDSDREFNITTDIRDVEILRVSNINVIARGCRFGRIWLLKGLRPEMRDSSACRRQLQKEFEIHSRLHNPAVAQAVGFEEIPELGLCIIEEWIEGKTLAELLREGKLTGKERKKILREIIAAAGYLHSMGVIHRDLKPSNIMVRNAGKSVVLIDFGLADTDDYIELKQPAGTPGYISPEQMDDKSAAISDDIYSIGAIMRDLTPEYGAIIRRCTGALRKRPKDTAELQKMIARRERMPKYLLTSAVAACAIFIATLATLHILSLSDSANEAKRAISQAKAATEDARSR